jgi:hypothetical protein
MATGLTDAMLPAPPTPGPRNIAASLARALRLLALAVKDGVVRLLLVEAVGNAFLFLSLVSAWLLAAGIAAVDVRSVVCGVDCAVVLAAARVNAVATFSFTIFCTPALLVFVIRAAPANRHTDEAEDYDLEVREGSSWYSLQRKLAPFYPNSLIKARH